MKKKFFWRNLKERSIFCRYQRFSLTLRIDKIKNKEIFNKSGQYCRPHWSVSL